MTDKEKLDNLLKRVEKLEKDSHPRRKIITPEELLQFRNNLLQNIENIVQSVIKNQQPMPPENKPGG